MKIGTCPVKSGTGWLGSRPPTQPAHSPVVLANVEGIVLVKYFFGDRSESVASRFGVLSKYAVFTTFL